MGVGQNSILYEINTPVYLNDLSTKYGRLIGLDRIPAEEIERLVATGAGTVWLMGIWQRSPAAVRLGLHDKALQAEFAAALPDFLAAKDFVGSAYAVREYSIPETYGGQAGLATFREQLQAYNIGLMLDFVPNHTAPDHAWTTDHHDYYLHDTEGNLVNGKDPFLDPWPDVVQLNAFSAGYRQAAIETLNYIATISDGVRCDMAMLMTNKVFAQTWSNQAGAVPETEFWAQVITTVRQSHPDFTFLAEVYWDMESELLSQGFDYCYDKTLYDHLLEGNAPAAKQYLQKSSEYQNHLVHFIENHDEPRAASIYSPNQEKAATAIVATLPGIWLLNDGQAEGYTTKIPVHLARGPQEPINPNLSEYYGWLLATLKSWQLTSSAYKSLQPSDSNVFAAQWTHEDTVHLAIINYSPNHTTTTIGSQEFQLLPWQVLLS